MIGGVARAPSEVIVTVTRLGQAGDGPTAALGFAITPDADGLARIGMIAAAYDRAVRADLLWEVVP